LSEAQLKNAIGLPLAEVMVIVNAIDVKHTALIEDSAFNVNNRTDYKLSAVGAKLLQIDQDRIKAGVFPKLSMYGRYGGVGFGDVIGQSFSSVNDFSVIGIKLNVPIFDGFKRRSQTAQAKYKYLNALENISLDTSAYHLEHNNAKTKMLKEKINAENNKRNIDLAQSVFNSTDLQYRKGVTGLTEWLNAQYSLKEAQNNYLSSQYNYYLALMDFEKANGNLQTFYKNL
jgi:outer membrane protein TolC